MLFKCKNPAALAGADRATVTVLLGKMDITDSTPCAIDLQVRRIAARYAVSLAVAVVIAELAFSSGRQS